MEIMIFSLLISFMEKLGVPLLGMLFKTIALRVHSAGLDSSALDQLSQLVDSAEVNPALASGEDKYHWVFNQFVAYLQQHGTDVAVSLVESLVQMMVCHRHTATNASMRTTAQLTPDPAVTSPPKP